MSVSASPTPAPARAPAHRARARSTARSRAGVLGCRAVTTSHTASTAGSGHSAAAPQPSALLHANHRSRSAAARPGLGAAPSSTVCRPAFLLTSIRSPDLRRRAFSHSTWDPCVVPREETRGDVAHDGDGHRFGRWLQVTLAGRVRGEGRVAGDAGRRDEDGPDGAWTGWRSPQRRRAHRTPARQGCATATRPRRSRRSTPPPARRALPRPPARPLPVGRRRPRRRRVHADARDPARGSRTPSRRSGRYLLTSVRHLAYDRSRAERRLDLTDDLADIQGIDPDGTIVPFTDPALAGLERTMAARAFATLPERWQAVLWHLEVEGDSPADIAPLFGLSANAVSALGYRAREGLRQAYLQEHLAAGTGALGPPPPRHRREARGLYPGRPGPPGGAAHRGAPRRVRGVPRARRGTARCQRGHGPLGRGAARARRGTRRLPGVAGLDRPAGLRREHRRDSPSPAAAHSGCWGH